MFGRQSSLQNRYKYKQLFTFKDLYSFGQSCFFFLLALFLRDGYEIKKIVRRIGRL
jgi:hypothetical protein